MTKNTRDYCGIICVKGEEKFKKKFTKGEHSKKSNTFVMKVHLISKETIEDFARHNARSRSSLQDWLTKLKYASWNEPEDIQHTFNSADLLGNGSGRVVFDIGGNNYRMVCKYWFGATRVHLYIKWIGTHAEYSKLCKMDSQYIVDDF